jgi:hypothetical protein
MRYINHPLSPTKGESPDFRKLPTVEKQNMISSLLHQATITALIITLVANKHPHALEVLPEMSLTSKLEL